MIPMRKKRTGIVFWIVFAAAVLAAACLLYRIFTVPRIHVVLDGCRAVQTEGTSGEIVLTGICQKQPAYPGQKLYVMELKPWEDEIPSRREPAGSVVWKKERFSLTVPLLEETEDTRLFSSFVVAEKRNGIYRPVSKRIYITNPEAVAYEAPEVTKPSSKKGLLVDLDFLQDAAELGVQHAIVNIDISQFFGMGDTYEYEGHTYHFNTAFIRKYDDAISAFTKNGICVTAVLLNSWNDEWPELRLPGVARTEGASYYQISTATEEGTLETAVTAAYLADRYSGRNDAYGAVTNWIIGNEINNPDQWNYAGNLSFEEYMREYERSFRVIYTAVKAENPGACVFYSVDRDWNYKDRNEEGTRKLTEKYSAKQVVDRFNEDIRCTGNIDWQLAFHPYSDPMTEPEFWTGDNLVKATESSNAEIINFQNMQVLTDYLQREEFLTEEGKVRHVILSEQGFTAISPSRGSVEELQAEAFEKAYRIAKENPYIDAFILSRQVDAPPEVNASLAFGLWSCEENGRPKEKRKIWQVFKEME